MVVDLRSDTVTVPTPEMREAMRTAEVGDDVMGEDPTVKELEAYVAELTGKEAGLYVPSGTMGNLIAQLVHCDARLSEVLVGDQAHTVLCEAGGAAGLGGIHARQVPTNDDGTLDLETVRAMIRTANVHHPVTRLVILENTHNFKGGRVLPLDYVRRMRALCTEHGLALHCDGARLWHAAVALDQPPHVLAEPFDTLSLCLSKGLGAPVGSVLVGPAAFIARARHTRKALGGGMRQAGVIAAAGLVAARDMRARLAEDHSRARALAAALEELGFAMRHEVETNIVIFGAGRALPGLTGAEVQRRCEAKGVLLLPLPTGDAELRVVTHCGVGDRDVELAIRALRAVVAEHATAPQSPRVR